MLNMINCYTEVNNPRNWCQMVAPLCFAFNSAPHASTGVSPHFALFGVKSRLCIDAQLILPNENLLEIQDRVQNMEAARLCIKNRIEESQRNNEKYYNNRHKMVHFAAGDKVLVKDILRKPGVCEKMRKKMMEGRILEKVSSALYKVEVDGTIIDVGIDRLCEFHKREESKIMKELPKTDKKEVKENKLAGVKTPQDRYSLERKQHPTVVDVKTAGERMTRSKTRALGPLG